MHANLRVDATCAANCATWRNGSGVDGDGEVGIHAWADLLPLPNLIILRKMLIQMHLEIHISQKS